MISGLIASCRQFLPPGYPPGAGHRLAERLAGVSCPARKKPACRSLIPAAPEPPRHAAETPPPAGSALRTHPASRTAERWERGLPYRGLLKLGAAAAGGCRAQLLRTRKSGRRRIRPSTSPDPGRDLPSVG